MHTRAVFAKQRRCHRQRNWSKAVEIERCERNSIEEYFQHCLQIHFDHIKFGLHQLKMEDQIKEKDAIAYQHLFHGGLRKIKFAIAPTKKLTIVKAPFSTLTFGRICFE